MALYKCVHVCVHTYVLMLLMCEHMFRDVNKGMHVCTSVQWVRVWTYK